VADHPHSNDLAIPPLVFGTMARASSDPNLRQAMFRYALKQGIRAFDTAPLYEFGATETQLGEVLTQSAHVAAAPVEVYSKVGLSWREDSRGPVHFETTAPTGERRVIHRDSRPQAIRQDVEESLQRLGRERLDLAQVHFRDTETPIVETMQALLELRQQGKVKEIGVCNFTLQEVKEAVAALAPVPLAANQIRLNLLQRGPLTAKGLVEWCRAQGIAVLAYSPLAEGRLARPPSEPEQTPDAVAEALAELAALTTEAGVSMAALAVAWLSSQPGVSGALTGASTPTQLDDILNSPEVPADLIRQAAMLFEGVQLRDPWEGPFWKRKLRGFKRRVFGE
jgi:aryl-alcohol dehydrogenase-like predicted oxidoreductase